MADLIRKSSEGLIVPDRPAIPFVEGDGTGPDIWRATRHVLDGAVERAYGARRAIEWVPVLAGERAFRELGDWLPPETEEAFRRHLVGIKGPLTTPVGGGIRSLNVTLRRHLDLYVCLRPVKWIPGVPSPVREPERVDMVVFRENTEDVYAGYEVAAGSPEAARLAEYLAAQFGWRFAEETGRSFRQYLVFVRVEAAKRLLAASTLKVWEVAEQVGFLNVGYPTGPVLVVSFGAVLFVALLFRGRFGVRVRNPEDRGLKVAMFETT